MGWSSAIKKTVIAKAARNVAYGRADFPLADVDWARLVTVDFETYYDVEYTLSKQSTSEYVRDPRFKAQMVGIKIGAKPTKWYPHKQVRSALSKINWSTHSVLCHNTQFDGFILSHHYGIVPVKYYDTLSMARGLHSNEIGASLDEVAQYYGRGSKIEGVLETTKGIHEWSPQMYKEVGVYCVQDVDLTYDIFCDMHKVFPADEMDLVHITINMFCNPVLKVDLPRVEKELIRELDKREQLFYAAVNPRDWEKDEAVLKAILKTRAERALTGKDRDMLIIKRVIGSNERFADLLRAEGIEPPVKVSKAWIKLSKDEKEERIDEKFSYAFAKDDLEFVNLPDKIDEWRGELDPNKKRDVPKISAKQDRLRDLVHCRLAVKSTTNITRAQRFLTAGANGMSLPCGYAYARAHTLRWGGNNKMNMQNLTRGGELRLSILAPKGHRLAVVDSGQIEARVNGWLWGQDDLMDAFRSADKWDKKTMGIARGDSRDAYCRFADDIYHREITTEDGMERFVGKVCVAEGELVLTKRGLVPINLISKVDRLWDGVEWVRHDGVIDQGIKEVITYDGLTATADHEVFTEDGRIIPLGQAASEMARLQITGTEGQNLRFCDSQVIADTPRKRLSVRIGEVQSFGGNETDERQQSEERQDDLIFQKRPQTGNACGSSGETIRRDSNTLQQPGKQAVGELRRAGDQVHVREQDAVYSVGGYESSAQGLQRRGDRQDGQRRPLQAWEFEAGDTNAASSKQTQFRQDHMARVLDPVVGLSQPVQPELDLPANAPRTDWRATVRKVHVYDIANAGPRKRFTVSGKLVLNCVLGLGFQMGAAKLQMTLAKGALGGPPVFFSLDECKKIIDTYRRKNHAIQRGWEICKGIIEDMAAGRQGSHGPISWDHEVIYLPNGLTLKYPDLRKARNEDSGWDEWSYQAGDMRSKIYGGLLCENIVQCLARIIVGWQMLQISRKHRVVMTTHDEVVACVKAAQADSCFKFMVKCMSTAPAWCSDIPLNCEGGTDVNYSK